MNLASRIKIWGRGAEIGIICIVLTLCRGKEEIKQNILNIQINLLQ